MNGKFTGDQSLVYNVCALLWEHYQPKYLDLIAVPNTSQTKMCIPIIWVDCLNGIFHSSDCVFNYHFSQAVLEAHNAVISSMKPGVNWVDMHM